jgi:lysozyme family protein
MAVFDDVMEFIFKWEGGYVDHPDDPGGATNFGISQRSYPDLDIKNLTKEEAKKIYYEDYWLPSGADELIYPDALALMDFAVHSGVYRAVQYWEKSRTPCEYINIRSKYLRNIRDRETGELLWNSFGRGWTARLDALRDEIDLYMHHPDVELLQIFHGPNVWEFSPERVTVGRTRRGTIKFMVRV